MFIFLQAERNQRSLHEVNDHKWENIYIREPLSRIYNTVQNNQTMAEKVENSWYKKGYYNVDKNWIFIRSKGNFVTVKLQEISLNFSFKKMKLVTVD